MHNRFEHLPEVPRWKYVEIKLYDCNYQTVEPMVLYYCDRLDLIRYLFSNPAFANCMEYDAYELIDGSTNYHIYGEFMSAQFTWCYQACLLLCIYVKFSAVSQHIFIYRTTWHKGAPWWRWLAHLIKPPWPLGQETEKCTQFFYQLQILSWACIWKQHPHHLYSQLTSLFWNSSMSHHWSK